MAHRQLLLGHRGMRRFPQVKENTIEAFELALQHGCDGFEFDVRLTGDGRAVVCHDSKIGGVVVNRARSEQLAGLPLLDQVLQRFQHSAFLDIELKVAGLEKFLMKTLIEFSPKRGYVVSSFLPEVIRNIDPLTPKGIICETRSQLLQWTSLKVEYVMAHWKLLSEELILQLHEAGKKVFGWTVNDTDRMRRFAEWGVDGIVSDNTRLLVQTLAS